MLDLTKYRRIFLKDYTIDINIGVHDFEKKSPQIVVINVDLYILLEHTTCKNDNINDIFSYSYIKKSIIEITNNRHINLQETLCDEIMDKMMNHNLVYAARVSTKKANIYAEAKGIGVERFSVKN